MVEEGGARARLVPPRTARANSQALTFFSQVGFFPVYVHVYVYDRCPFSGGFPIAPALRSARGAFTPSSCASPFLWHLLRHRASWSPPDLVSRSLSLDPGP